MFNRLLIANRGEIACRIMQTANALGIETIAVYSDADRNALHVAKADHSVHIGGSQPRQSYLDIDRIIRAAKSLGAQAVHPGYGFLAESAEFSKACTEAGLIFVGPTPEAMQLLGGKANAKALARKARIPVVPGNGGEDQSIEALTAAASTVGYPLMIKAVAGGGGRGMRRVDTPVDFETSLESARREAAAAFGNDRVLIEKVIVSPRHIEVQIFADRRGNVVHMGERECTLQRRHQKVVEEAPASGMTAGLRERLTGAAVTIARAARYEGAGTVEFLVEGGSLVEDAPWYFMEMNTRLQVEHPVTEAITGQDLVEWQLRIAAGEKLPLPQSAIKRRGHAIEVRLCAEEPSEDFRPSTGTIVAWQPPAIEGVRIDSGFEQGRIVPPYYDSLLAKIVTCRSSRNDAISASLSAVREFKIAGPATNARFLCRLLSSQEFSSATFDTGLIDRNLSTLTAIDVSSPSMAIATGARALLVARQLPSGTNGTAAAPCLDPWSDTNAFQLHGDRSAAYRMIAGGVPATVRAHWRQGRMSFEIEGQEFASAVLDVPWVVVEADRAYVVHDMVQTIVEWPAYAADITQTQAGHAVMAPLPGRIAKITVSAGDKIDKGDVIAVVEAMKMEHIVKAQLQGTVAIVHVHPGDQVTAGQLIATLAGDESQ